MKSGATSRSGDVRLRANVVCLTSTSRCAFASRVAGSAYVRAGVGFFCGPAWSGGVKLQGVSMQAPHE